MKRNISELLDDLPAEDMELTNTSLLSARRIKKRTMEKVVAPRSSGLRWLWRAAAVAAVIVALSVSVFAADVVWNDSALFSAFFGGAPSSDEMSLMDDIGRRIGESVTQNGATITAVQAVADENTYWVHLRMEAPEDAFLPDLQADDICYYYLGNKLDRAGIQHRWSEEGKWEVIRTAHTLKSLPDENPEDNVKEFIAIFHGKDGETFDVGGQLRLVIPGLYIHKGQSKDMQTLFAGEFVFDITVDTEKMERRKLVIDIADVSFFNEEYDYTTTVSKVTISPLHVSIACTYTEPNCPYIFPYGGPLDIVMKDGTIIHAADAYFDAREQTVVDPDDVAGCRLTCLEIPVVTENIDYIVLGEEHIFDVN